LIDWAKIQSVCLDAVDFIDPEHESAMTAFGIASWLFLTILVIYKIVLSTMKDQYERQLRWLRGNHLTFDTDTKPSLSVWLSICLIVYGLLIAQLWTFFRLRRFQSDMTEAAGGKFPDGQWGFGQIVAVAVFFPVAVEVLFLWKRRSLR
jgi:hypothetical protein